MLLALCLIHYCCLTIFFLHIAVGSEVTGNLIFVVTGAYVSLVE